MPTYGFLQKNIIIFSLPPKEILICKVVPIFLFGMSYVYILILNLLPQFSDIMVIIVTRRLKLLNITLVQKKVSVRCFDDQSIILNFQFSLSMINLWYVKKIAKEIIVIRYITLELWILHVIMAGFKFFRNFKSWKKKLLFEKDHPILQLHIVVNDLQNFSADSWWFVYYS